VNHPVTNTCNDVTKGRSPVEPDIWVTPLTFSVKARAFKLNYQFICTMLDYIISLDWGIDKKNKSKKII